jgi:hypothetical protein
MEPKIETLTELLKDVIVYEAPNGFSYIGKAVINPDKDMLYNSLKVETKVSDSPDSQKKLYAKLLTGARKEMPPIIVNRKQMITEYFLHWSPDELKSLYQDLFTNQKLKKEWLSFL